MNKAELRTAIRRDRATLDALVSTLSESQLTASGANGSWSVKDHLAHIAAWERMIVAHLQDGSDADIANMDAASYAAATLDELNHRLHQMSRDRPVADVLREFAEAHGAVVAFIAAMPEQQLTAAYWSDDPQVRTVLEKVAGDTFLHYEEHARWIGDIVGRAAEAR
jgi:hypothetical protein